MGEPPISSTISIEDAIAAYAAGDPIIVVEAGPEALGDITIPAQLATPETMMLLIEHGGGVIYATLPEDRCTELEIPLQVPDHDSGRWQAEARVTVEARDGVTTGISAADRVATVRTLSDPSSTAHDLVRPGHVVPFAARPGGTIERPSITEASVDLARLAGLAPAGVDAEILNSDGSRALGEDVVRFAREHGLPLVLVSDIAAYRLRNDPTVTLVREHAIDTRCGRFQACLFRDRTRGRQHLALVPSGADDDAEPVIALAEVCPLGVLDRTHECSRTRDFDAALVEVAAAGRGAVISLDVGIRGCAPFEESPASSDAVAGTLEQILHRCNIVAPRAAVAGSRVSHLKRSRLD